MYALPFVLSMLNTSIAEESETDNKVRLGICGGVSPQCLITTIQLDLPGERWGVSLGLLPTWGVTPRYYLPFTNTNQERWRPYVYSGIGLLAISPSAEMVIGAGIGTDICLGKSKRLILQPSVGLGQTYHLANSIFELFKDQRTSASLSILYESGK